MLKNWLVAVAVALLSTAGVRADLVDHVSTPVSNGVQGGGDYDQSEGGFRIDWNVSQNMDLSWHYIYSFTNAASGELTPAVSHIILQLSDNITEDDVYNFGGDFENYEFGTFGPHPSNPGFPAGESIFGLKINTGGDQLTVSFDSTRAPMWGDFYVKGGRDSFAYNTGLGIAVSNPNDYNAASALDASGDPISKILVPDTVETAVPEPTSLALLAAGLGSLGIFRYRRTSAKRPA